MTHHLVIRQVALCGTHLVVIDYTPPPRPSKQILVHSSVATVSSGLVPTAALQLRPIALTPEAVCETAASLTPEGIQTKFGFDLVSEYFEKQCHSSLPSVAEELVHDGSACCDDVGAQMSVLTHSPVLGKVGQDPNVGGRGPARILPARALFQHGHRKCVRQYCKVEQGISDLRFLLIHEVPLAASPRLTSKATSSARRARARPASRV